MASFDYTGLRDNTVEPLIAQFGKAATLTQPGTPTGPEYDPTPGTPTIHTGKVLETKFTVSDKTGTLVQTEDRKFILSTAGDPNPDLQGTLTIGSSTLQVVSLKPLQPGPVVMFWFVHCRK